MLARNTAPASSFMARTMERQEPEPGSLDLMSVPPSPFACLSIREREIAKLVAEGHSNKEIARDLAISPNTVCSHMRQIFAKLGIVRRAELCMLWYRAEASELA